MHNKDFMVVLKSTHRWASAFVTLGILVGPPTQPKNWMAEISFVLKSFPRLIAAATLGIPVGPPNELKNWMVEI